MPFRAGDGRLAARAAAGDERAFEQLVRRHDAALRGYCVQLLRRLEDAEDALQEALASAHRALLESGPPDHPRAWLFAIARNRCLSVLRAAPPTAAPLDETNGPASASAAEVALSRAELRALAADLDRLDPEVREALALTRLGDFSHRQAAAIIGCDPERVRTLVRQARIELAAARLAREQPCHEIRAELAQLRRGGFRRAHIRRHLADCAPCRTFRRRLAEQDRALGLLLPVPAVAVDAVRSGLASGGAVAGAGSSAGGAAVGGATLGGVGLAGPFRRRQRGSAAFTRQPRVKAEPAPLRRSHPAGIGRTLTVRCAPRRRPATTVMRRRAPRGSTAGQQTVRKQPQTAALRKLRKRLVSRSDAQQPQTPASPRAGS